MGEHLWAEIWETALDQLDEKLIRHPHALQLIEVPDWRIEVYIWAIEERVRYDIVGLAGLMNGGFLVGGWVKVACSAKYDLPDDDLPWGVNETHLVLRFRVKIEPTLEPRSEEMTSDLQVRAVHKLWQREY